MKHILLAFITIISFNLVFGQATKKEIEKADNTLYSEAFESAYAQYSDLSTKYPNDNSFNYHMLIAYHLSGGRGTDITELLSYEKDKGATDEFYNYWLGRVHFLRYEFDLAIDHFEAFNTINKYKSNSLLNESMFMIKWAKRAKTFYQEIDDYEINPLSNEINTSANEVAPVFFKGHDELIYFQSLKDESYQAMHAIKTSDTWNNVEAISNLGKFGESELRAEILSDEKRLVVYKTKDGGDLFTSEFTSSGWSDLKEYDPTLVAKIKSDFFISSDEKTVLFSSRKGKKDFDIFQITKSANGWSDPSPLNINTDGFDEDFPYMTDDGKTLYFSSNRPESIGGYDVFVSTKNKAGLWSQPKNMGYPINTIDHELHFQMNHGSNTGYFSTNRLHSEGGLDIYYFFKIEKFDGNGVVTNKVTNRPVSDVLLKFHPKKYTDESIEAKTNSTGKYDVTLIKNEDFIVEFYINQEKLDEKTINVTGTNDNLDFAIAVKDSIPEKTDYVELYKGDIEAEKNEETKRDITDMKSKLPTMKSLYFDSESFALSAEQKNSLSKLAMALKSAKKVNVEISGYADSAGSTGFNKTLSKKRAREVSDYLVSKGVSKSQLSSVGFGESNPAASNESEEGKAKNRRVEFKFSM